MTDGTGPDDPRESGDELEPAPLSAADESAVSALLAALPDPALPSDVEERIAAAIANDPATPPPPAFPHATTVVPSHAAPASPGRWRRPRLLQAAAALVAVALIGAAAVGVTGIIGDDSSSSTASGPQAGPITASGKDYTAEDLGPGVLALLDPAAASASAAAASASAGAAGHTGDTAAGAVGTDTQPKSKGSSASGGEKSSSPDSDQLASTDGSDEQMSTAQSLHAQTQKATPSAAEIAAVTSLIRTPATRDQCVQTLAGAPGVAPLAIDIAAFDGRAAAVIVLPHPGDPTRVDVWVVGSTCSDKDSPFPLHYEQVDR